MFASSKHSRSTVLAPAILIAAFALVPAASAQCTFPVLGSGVPLTIAGSPASVRVSTVVGTFAAVGVRSDAGTQHVLTAYTSTGSLPDCGSGPLATSDTPAGVEVVIGDFRTGHNAPGGRVATATRTAGGGAATFEWESLATPLVAGAPPESVLAAPPVIDLFQSFLEGGSSYTLNLASAGADLKVLVFRNPGADPFWSSRSSPELLAVAGGPTLFTAPASDDYALVVVNDDGAAGTYTLWIEQCQEPDTLFSTVARPVQYPYRDRLDVVDPYWTGVGVRSDAGSDWNIALYDTARGGPEPICFLGEIAASARTGGVDFVVGDLSSGPIKSFYARETRAGGGGGALIEWDGGPDELTVGDPPVPIQRDTGPGDVLEIWDVAMAPGTTYTILFSPAGDAALRWFLFANPDQGPGGARWFARDQAVLTATGNALYTPTSTGWHGLAVVNENGGAGSYSLAVAGAPLVGVPGAGESARRTALGAIEPNPVRDRATIGWTLASPGRVAVEILDVAGRAVARIDAGTQPAGPGALSWDSRAGRGARPGAGVYFARLLVDGAPIGAARLVLLR